MIFLVSVIFFIFGLLVGSFFNVATIRYNPDSDTLLGSKTISGRSRCDHCGTTLRWFDLIPLFSFLFLFGKCRECKERIFIQHPIIEFLTGAIFAGIPLFVVHFFSFSNSQFYLFAAPWWQYALALVWVAVFCVFLLMVVIDLKHFIIPNGLNLFLLILGGLYIALVSLFRNEINLFYDSFFRHYGMIFSFSESFLYSHLFGFVIGGAFFILLVVITFGRGIGIGDVKLAFALGLLLGWPDIAFATMLSFIIGGAISGALVILGKKHLKEKLPFAPFFVAGACLVVFFGHIILKGYFSIFGL